MTMPPETTQYPPGVLSLIYHLRHTSLNLNHDKTRTLRTFRLSDTERDVFSICGDVGYPNDSRVADILYLTAHQVRGSLFRGAGADDQARAAQASGAALRPGVLSFLYHLVHTKEVYDRFHADKGASRKALMDAFDVSDAQQAKINHCIRQGPFDDESLKAVLALAVPELSGDNWYKAW
ncbi:hypothetical protein [Sorangium sp. So ce385]|uniref:hypothetical protein n=1 Tax=Sorangium sp. So ce385 TaxID=3133308 RepID=UPI003F5C4BF1